MHDKSNLVVHSNTIGNVIQVGFQTLPIAVLEHQVSRVHANHQIELDNQGPWS